MCYSGCTHENWDGDCTLHGNLCPYELENDEYDEPEDEYVSEQDVADAEDRYFSWMDK